MKRGIYWSVVITFVLGTFLPVSARPVQAMLPPAEAQAEALNLTVNSTVDEDDANPGDGICAAAGGTCTLRAAITETNAWPGADFVSVPAGTYYGTTLEILDSLHLYGTRGFTVLDGWSIQMEKTSSQDFNVDISGITLQNGGGISSELSGPDLVMTDCQIINNHNTGIIIRWGDIEIHRSIISGNVDTQPEDGNIGGIIANASNLRIFNSSISNNSGGTGGIYADSGMILSGSTVSGNTGTGRGGMAITGGARIVNSTISGNTGAEGAGIWTNQGMDIYSSTITQNSAVGNGGQWYSGNGGGIYFYGDGSTTLYNTIVAGNHSSAGSNDCDGPITSGGYNLIGSTSGCEFAAAAGDLLNTPARLGQLQDNGGGTLTHALLPGSPAIDAANPEGSAETEGLDQRGGARNRDGNGDELARDDIGAYEAAGPTLRNVELSGQIDLFSGGFDIQGDYAYVGTNGRLLIMDITDPIHPRKIATTPTGLDDLGPLAAGGDYVYYLALDQQSMDTYMVDLHIIDVSDPALPLEIGFLSLGMGYDPSLAISGGYVYISGLDSGMTIVDATDPARPARVKTLPGLAEGLAVQGQYLYIDAPRGGGSDLLVLDISTPASPSLVGTADGIGGSGRLLIQGNYVYTTDSWFGLHVIDVSDPAHPQQVNPETNFAGRDELLAAGGNQVYLRQGQTIQVIDVSLPANPVMTGSFQLPDPEYFNFLLTDTSGQYLFATYAEFRGISAVRVFDVSDPSGLYEIWSIHNSGLYNFNISGNTIYTLDGGGLNILSTAAPGSPVTIGSYSWASDYPSGLTVQDTYAYVIRNPNGGSGELRILNVSDPANVVEIGVLGFAQPVYSPTLVNSLPGSPFIYLQTEDHQLALVNVSDPMHPTLAGYYDGSFQQDMSDFLVSGSTLYLLERPSSAIDGRFHSLDISNPAAPQPLASVPLANPVDMDLEGSLMYIAGSPGSVHVFNVENPAAPVEVAIYDTSAPDDARITSIDVDGTRVVYSQLTDDINTRLIVTGLAELQSGQEPAGIYTLVGQLSHAEMTGNRVYLNTWQGNGQTHLHALDLSAPDNLGFAGETVLGVNFGGLGVVVVGNYAYEIGRDDRLHVVDIQDPEAPAEIGGCDLPISLYYNQTRTSLAVSGVYVYIGSNDGMLIVDVSDPHLPIVVHKYLTTGTLTGIVIRQPYAYLGNTDSFQVLDISNPSAPVIKSAYAVNESGLAIEGNYAYISNYQDGGILILDISNPSSPSLVASYTGGIQYPSAITVNNGRAFIAASGKLHILDVSNPALPVPINVYSFTNVCPYPMDVVVKEGYVYLLKSSWMGGGPGARCSQPILDISNPAAPVLAGIVETGTGNSDIFVDEGDGMVYLADLNKTLSYFRFAPGVVAAPPGSDVQLRSAAGDVLLDLPAGLFNATARVTHTALPQASHPLDGLVFAGHSFSLQSTLADPMQPAYLTVSYTDAELQGLDENELRLYYWDTASASWQDGVTTCGSNFTYLRSPAKNQLGLDLCKFGEFALFAPALPVMPYSVNLPIVFSRPAAVYVISGYVTKDNGYTPLEGVTLECNGATALSNADRGRYSLSVPAGTCVLTPSLAGYTFNPPSIELTVPPHASGINFTGTRLPTSTPTAIPSPTKTSTFTPTVIASPTKTSTFTPTVIASPTKTSTFTPTVIASPTKTSTFTPTVITSPTKTSTFTPTVIALPTKTPTRTPTLLPCDNLISNSGFEYTADWELPITVYPADYSTTEQHDGSRSMRTGITNSAHNVYSYSSADQTVSIPSNVESADLTVWFYPASGESAQKSPPRLVPTTRFGQQAMSGDIQYGLILDQYGNWIDTFLWQRSNGKTWTKLEVNLLNLNGHNYAGRTISIHLGTYNDGYDGITSMYVDDVTLSACD